MSLKRKIQKLDEEHSVASTSHNPVEAMCMFNSTEEDFRECRWTADGEISYIDGVAHVFGCSKKEAHQKLARHMRGNPEVTRAKLWKFPGAGQRDTPIGPFHEFLELCSQLPGAAARVMRKEQAQITTRAIAGDVDLVRAIIAQKDHLSPELRAILMTGLLSSEEAKAINEFAALSKDFQKQQDQVLALPKMN
jgi:hypothetical protein